MLRFLLADDPLQFDEAERFFSAVQHGGLLGYLPECVLAECVYILQEAYEVPRKEIAEKFVSLLGYRGMIGGNRSTIFKEALRIYAATDLSVVNAIASAMARQPGWTIETNDIDLRNMSRALDQRANG